MDDSEAVSLEQIRAFLAVSGVPRWATPFELFQPVPHCENLLRSGVTLAQLESFAQLQSDTEAALDMQRAKRQLLARVAQLSA